MVEQCYTSFSEQKIRMFFSKQADRGFATSQFRSDEDGTILAHILHGSDWYTEKGGERSAGSGSHERFLSSASLLLKWYYILLSKYYKVIHKLLT